MADVLNQYHHGMQIECTCEVNGTKSQILLELHVTTHNRRRREEFRQIRWNGDVWDGSESSGRIVCKCESACLDPARLRRIPKGRLHTLVSGSIDPSILRLLTWAGFSSFGGRWSGEYGPDL